MTLRPVLSLMLVPLALAACSRSDDAAAPAPTPTMTTQAVPTAAADGTAFTAGRWEVGEDASGATATFAPEGAAAILAMKCDRATRVLSLTRTGAAGAEQVQRIEVGPLKADVRLSPKDGVLHAAIDAGQPIFTAWSDPAARIALSAPGTETLNLPGNAGISRVVAACS